MTEPPSRDNPICVALDVSDPNECVRLAAETAAAGAHKIGLTAFVAGGPQVVRELTATTRLFLDLKLHDIPAQVAGAVRAIADLDVTFTTIHSFGGADMMRAAVEAAGGRVMILAVTVLTSLDDADLAALGVESNTTAQVLRLAENALANGVAGLVCSPREVRPLRKRFGPSVDGGPFLVVPGIRPHGAASNDQKRTLTPREAIDEGADLLVVGRPITASADPGRSLRATLTEVGA